MTMGEFLRTHVIGGGDGSGSGGGGGGGGGDGSGGSGGGAAAAGGLGPAAPTQGPPPRRPRGGAASPRGVWAGPPARVLQTRGSCSWPPFRPLRSTPLVSLGDAAQNIHWFAPRAPVARAPVRRLTAPSTYQPPPLPLLSDLSPASSAPRPLPPQVVGRKYVRLVSSAHSDALYPHGAGMHTNSSRVDADAPDTAKFPRYASAPYSECILEPGQMLYIPPRHWHFVKAVTVSFSCSFWWS